jgi:hypothetical protein
VSLKEFKSKSFSISFKEIRKNVDRRNGFAASAETARAKPAPASV